MRLLVCLLLVIIWTIAGMAQNNDRAAPSNAKVSPPSGSNNQPASGASNKPQSPSSTTQNVPVGQVQQATAPIDIESSILAQAALKAASDDIAHRLGNETIQALVVFDEQGLQSLQAYKVVSSQIDLLVLQFNSEMSPKKVESGLAAVPTIASGMIKDVSDLLTVMKTDVEVTSATASVEKIIILSTLVNSLRTSKTSVEYPIYAPTLFPVHPLDDQKTLLDSLNNLQSQIDKAKQLVLSLQPADKDRIERLKSLIDSGTAFIGSISGTGSPSSLSPIAALVNAGILLDALPKSQCYFLLIKLGSAGGTRTIRKSLIRGTKIDRSGGAIVSYMLFDREGNLYLANTITNLQGPQR